VAGLTLLVKLDMTTPSATSSIPSTTTEMAASSSFSYAQAAKGQGATPSTTAAAGSNTTSSNQAQDSTSAPAVNKADSIEESSAEVPDAARNVAVEKPDADNVAESEADARSDAISEKRPESRRDDDSERLNRPWRRNDKGTRSSSAATHSLDENDTRKPRRGKKARQAEKQAGEQTGDKEQEPEPEAPKIELSEAPIPSVNIWHQRKEAQLAKVPTSQALANGSADHSEETSKPTKPTDDAAASNGVKPSRKSGDAARPERNGSRGSRVAEKDAKTEAPPSVEDAASWPTPETAIKEEKKKPAEKTDRPSQDVQDDAANGKPRPKEKWVTYDYVPTVSFETQLPQLRGSKPRGGARGVSGAGRTPAATQPSEKPSSTAPVSKPSEPKEKPREPVNGASSAAPSAQAGKRGSVDAANVRDHRKQASHAGTEKAKESTSAHAAVSFPRLSRNLSPPLEEMTSKG
jgi:la-related protein 1